MAQPTKLISPPKQKSGISEKSRAKANSGQVLVFALILTAIALIFATAILSYSSVEYLSTSSADKKNQSLSLAEAGIDYAINQLSTNTTYSGTAGTPIELGNGEFDVNVTGSGSTRTVIATGYFPSMAAYKASKTVKLNISITSETISFHYAVQIGNEGIMMYSNSTINGNAYSNGSITGYSNTQINGDAYAVGTISSPRPIVSGTKYQGAEPSEMPTLDYDFWKEQANINNDAYTGNYELNGNCPSNPADRPTLGPKKIVGNFTMNSNTCLIVTGPIYVTGNFAMNSNAKLYLY